MNIIIYKVSLVLGENGASGQRHASSKDSGNVTRPFQSTVENDKGNIPHITLLFCYPLLLLLICIKISQLLKPLLITQSFMICGTSRYHLRQMTKVQKFNLLCLIMINACLVRVPQQGTEVCLVRVNVLCILIPFLMHCVLNVQLEYFQ